MAWVVEWACHWGKAQRIWDQATDRREWRAGECWVLVACYPLGCPGLWAALVAFQRGTWGEGVLVWRQAGAV